MEKFFRKKDGELFFMEKSKTLSEWSLAKRKLSYDSSLQTIMKLKILLLMKFAFYLKLNLSFAWVKEFLA